MEYTGEKRQRIEASPYFPRSSICQNGKGAGFANKIGQLQKLVSGTEALSSCWKLPASTVIQLANLTPSQIPSPQHLPTYLGRQRAGHKGGEGGKGLSHLHPNVPSLPHIHEKKKEKEEVMEKKEPPSPISPLLSCLFSLSVRIVRMCTKGRGNGSVTEKGKK